MKIKPIVCGSILACLTIFTACEKKEEFKINEPVEIDKIAISNEVNVDTLKAFMYELNHIPVSEVVYDKKTEKFFFLGVEQYTKEDLTKYYFIFKERKEHE